jgi:hypothetical protein
VIQFEIGCELQVVDEYYYLNIFEHLTITSKLAKQLVIKKVVDVWMLPKWIPKKSNVLFNS